MKSLPQNTRFANVQKTNYFFFSEIKSSHTSRYFNYERMRSPLDNITNNTPMFKWYRKRALAVPVGKIKDAAENVVINTAIECNLN